MHGRIGETSAHGKEALSVLFLAHRIPFPANKGDKIRSCWQLQTLAERHQVDLCCFYDDPEDEKYVSDVRRYCRECYVERLSPLTSRMRALGAVLSGRPFTPAFFYSRRMDRRIRKALLSRSYDVIFVFSSSMAQYVGEMDGIPKVLDLVDVDSDKWEQYAKYGSKLLAPLWRWEAKRLAGYERELVSSFSTTLVCTDAEAELLRQKAPVGNIRVLEDSLQVGRYGCERIESTAEIRSWQPYVLLSGSMDYFPNVDAAKYFWRDIFPLVRSRVPAAHLVIAGRNPHRSILDMACDPSVHVTGTVADMVPYLAGAAVAVAPLRIARGVQTKVLEALASGVSVVSTRAVASALPKIIGSLVQVADGPAAFADAVVDLLRNGSRISADHMRTTLATHLEDLDLRQRFHDLLLRTASVRRKGAKRNKTHAGEPVNTEAQTENVCSVPRSG